MVPQQQDQKPDNSPRPVGRSRMHWIVISIAIIASIAFAVTAILILINESISQAVLTLTILSVIVGGLIGLLSLMFNFLQWFNSRPSVVPNPPTASVSPSQSLNNRNALSSPIPVTRQLPLPAQTTPLGIIEISSTANSRTTHQSEQAIKEKGATEPIPGELHQEDWAEAPHLDQFYGREKELAELERWIVGESCKVIAILGIGGIGKSALATKLAEQIQEEFVYVYWRSLHNAPPLESTLKNCVQFLSNQRQIDLPEERDVQITLLLQYLRDYRCLLVLDNMETILQSGNRVGQYREGYEGYGRLIQRIGEANHQSCLLLTSREKPKEIAHLEGKTAPIRSWQLSGLKQEEGQEVLKDKGLFGSDEAWASLIRLYSGNPLALKLASEPIRELFGGDIGSFLKRGKAVFGDIRDPLDLQFARLSELEREIMYWLAIDREAVSLDELREDMISFPSEGDLLVAVGSLRRRSMVESTGKALFTLQPVIMEYVNDRFVEKILEEIDAEVIKLFGSHALIKAQAKDYVRESQIRLILTPIANALLNILGEQGIEKKFKNILIILREKHPYKTEYAAGNILNLLIQLKSELRYYDFSYLTVWQAYLQNVALPEVNFAYADLANSVFTDTFGGIFSASFNLKGNMLAAATTNNQIRLWQIPDSTPLLTCEGHTNWVRCVAFSPNSELLASGSDDQTVRLWDVSIGKNVKILKGHSGRVYSVAFSPDGQILASSGEDKTIRLWQVSTGQSLNVLRDHDGRVYSLTFCHDGETIVSGSEDRTVRLWNISSGICFKTLAGHFSRVVSVAVSPDGHTIASGSEDQAVILWEVNTGKYIKSLPGHNAQVESVAFNSTGTILASGSKDKTVRLWDLQSGQCLQILSGHDNWVTSVVFMPNQEVLVSASTDQTVRMWDIQTGYCLKTLQGVGLTRYSIAFSPDGETIVGGSEDRCVDLWEVSTGRSLKTLRGHTHWVRSVAYSPKGDIIASGGEDQVVCLWDVITGQCIKALRGHELWIYSVTFSPDGTTVASGSADRTIRLWNVQTGQCAKILSKHTGGVWSVVFSPDSRIFASGSDDKTVQIWDAKTGKQLQVLRGHVEGVRAISFNFDGSILASGSDDRIVRLWNVQTGRCFRMLRGHTDMIYSIAFSPDGSLIATGGEDQSVRLWAMNTMQCLKTLSGHSSWIYSVAFSPDGRLIASSSGDGTIRLWNVQTGEFIRMLRSDRPYERMNITDVRGLTGAQKATLRRLGAIEE